MKEYSNVNIDDIKKPLFACHKNYIRKLELRQGLDRMLEFVPAKLLVLSISSEVEKIQFRELVKYLGEGFPEKVHIDLTLESCNTIRLADFEKFWNIVLKLNLKKLSIIGLNPILASFDFYESIKYCKSLRSVKLFKNHDISTELDIISQESSEYGMIDTANSHVKQWVLELNSNYITEEIKQRVQELILERNDNTIYIYNDFLLEEIPQMTQLFEFNPVSDCY